jgi:hypothetical protein
VTLLISLSYAKSPLRCQTAHVGHLWGQESLLNLIDLDDGVIAKSADTT